MASFKKFTSASVGTLLKHNNRSPNDTNHDNKEIDVTKTINNYFLKKGSVEAIHTRLNEVFAAGRADQIVLGEICVTLPEKVEAKDEKAFFRSAYNFFCDDFGERNIINAVVHKDETKPHLHLDFTPVVVGEYDYDRRYRLEFADWKERHSARLKELEEEYGKPVIERLCCKDLITREYLDNLHGRLNTYISDELGYDVEVVNGATVNGNKTILELKANKLQKEIEVLEKKAEVLRMESSTIIDIAKRSGVSKEDIGLLPLMQKIADLENQNAIYRKIIASQRYPYSKQEIEQLKAKTYFPALSAQVNVFDGRLTDMVIEDNAIIVIELYNNITRPLPQQKFIDSDDDLRNQTNLTLKMSGRTAFTVRSSRTSDKSFFYLRTDNEMQTYAALLEMENRLRTQEEEWRGRKIYMERISTDEYDIARTMLGRTQYQTIYLTGRDIEGKESKEILLQK